MSEQSSSTNRSASANPFTPRGETYCLNDAVDLLAPHRLRPRTKDEIYVDAAFFFDDDRLYNIWDRPTAVLACQTLGAQYARDLADEQSAPRLNDSLRTYERLAKHARSLAEELEALHDIERHMIHIPLLIATPASGQHQELRKAYARADQTSLPAAANTSGLRRQPTEQSMSTRLLRLAEYLEQLGPTLEDVIGRDRGKTRTLQSRWWGSAALQLIHKSWRLFLRLDVPKPATTADGPFLQFVQHIHDWVTGEAAIGTSRFGAAVKEYNDLIREHRDLQVQWQAIRARCPQTDAKRFQHAAYHGRDDSGQVPTEILAEVAPVVQRIREIERILMTPWWRAHTSL